MKHYRVAVVSAVSALLISGAALQGRPDSLGVPAARQARAGGQPRLVTVDLDQAKAVTLPDIKTDLAPATFVTSDQKRGWVVRVHGNRPIATPAVYRGRIYVGGGYGSHEFYAFDAVTGSLAWQCKCSDDGPSAAVVEDDCVAFNTESCTVIVCDASSGTILWQEWLGDPLMSQPAISQGRLYIAYPGGGRGQVSQSANTAPQAGAAPQAGVAPQAGAAPQEGGYHLLCAELRTGRHVWVAPIPADVISAPVVEGNKVVFTCMDGTTMALDAASGKLLWRKENAGTSAPLLAGGQVFGTTKVARGSVLTEGLVRGDVANGNAKDAAALAPGAASYFKPGNSGNTQIAASEIAALDASVGFGGGGPVAGSAMANHLNIQGVASGWAYQGSRAAYSRGQILNAQGRWLNGVDAANGDVRWRAEVNGRQIDPQAQAFAPPSLGRRNLYLVSGAGHVASLRQEDGRVNYVYSFGQPMAFQAALSGGSIYVGTNNGLVICLQAGDADADGWVAWGGNAQHNKSY